MSKVQKTGSYLQNRPEVSKIFDDLEVFHDFCRFELMPFNPADLYNRSSWAWRAYERSLNPNKKNQNQGYKRKQSNNNNNRRPQQQKQQ